MHAKPAAAAAAAAAAAGPAVAATCLLIATLVHNARFSRCAAGSRYISSTH